MLAQLSHLLDIYHFTCVLGTLTVLGFALGPRGDGLRNCRKRKIERKFFEGGCAYFLVLLVYFVFINACTTRPVVLKKYSYFTLSRVSPTRLTKWDTNVLIADSSFLFRRII